MSQQLTEKRSENSQIEPQEVELLQHFVKTSLNLK